MKALRKGDRGPEVRTLQDKLIAAGYPLPTTEYFGTSTDAAVRAFQLRCELVSDGIAGQKTLNALGIVDDTDTTVTASRLLGDLYAAIGAAGVRALAFAKNFAPLHPAARPPSQYRTSSQGLEFIFIHEAQKNVSNRLHWPGGKSGVTLGPGYDMKERSASVITDDMTAIGIDLITAKSIARAAGLKDTTTPTAQQFSKDNKSAVKLTLDQEKGLLRHVVPAYETMVKNALRVDLTQHQFDALVCFAYNPGGRFKTVANNINQGKVAAAMAAMRKANTSGGIEMEFLTTRRDDEVALYLTNNYGMRTA